MNGFSVREHVPSILVAALSATFGVSLLQGTDALAIHFTWKLEPTGVLDLLPTLERALKPFDARPHWGKIFHAVDRSLYPRLPEFVQLAERMDPAGKFRNEYLEKNVFAG